MSFHLTKLAMNAEFQDDPVAKNVLIALCWSYFDGAPHALMNQERICRRTGYKKRTVQDALARLKKDAAAAPISEADKKASAKVIDRSYGLINIDYCGIGSGVSPRYTINVARLEAMQYPEQLSFKLTSLRAVEPEQKGAAAASFMENPPTVAKGAAAAFVPQQKGAGDAKKDAAAAPYHENVILPYTTTHTHNNGGSGCVEGALPEPRSTFSIKQWFAYAKTQPNIINKMAFAASMVRTPANDSILELQIEIERQNKAAHQKPDYDCSICRGTGWESVPGRGAKPCACRRRAHAN